MSSDRHNAFVRRAIRELFDAADHELSSANVIVESLLVGVAMANFPSEPRKQALLIQEIADAASDRVRAVRGSDRG